MARIVDAGHNGDQKADGPGPVPQPEPRRWPIYLLVLTVGVSLAWALYRWLHPSPPKPEPGPMPRPVLAPAVSALIEHGPVDVRMLDPGPAAPDIRLVARLEHGESHVRLEGDTP